MVSKGIDVGDADGRKSGGSGAFRFGSTWPVRRAVNERPVFAQSGHSKSPVDVEASCFPMAARQLADFTQSGFRLVQLETRVRKTAIGRAGSLLAGDY